MGSEGSPLIRSRKLAGASWWEDSRVTEISIIGIERSTLKNRHRYLVGRGGVFFCRLAADCLRTNLWSRCSTISITELRSSSFGVCPRCAAALPASSAAFKVALSSDANCPLETSSPNLCSKLPVFPTASVKYRSITVRAPSPQDDGCLNVTHRIFPASNSTSWKATSRAMPEIFWKF